MEGLRFSVRKNRLERALYKGMQLMENAEIACNGTDGEQYVVLPAFDSGVSDWQWGRLRFRLELPSGGVCYLYAVVANDREAEDILFHQGLGLAEKKRDLSRRGCLRFVNQSDVLLYETEGRYLWIAMEVIGAGVRISDIVVWSPGDTFMAAFPEVYQERNSFLHRFLSIFSSLYNDLQEQISHMDALLAIDKAPKELLELYLNWLGIDAGGGFLHEDMLRSFLRESGTLLSYKGTANCLRRLCEIFIGETPLIVERGLMQPYVRGSDAGIYDRLYGSSPYDVTLLLEQALDAQKKEQLLHLLRQFQPVGSRLHLVALEKGGVLDGYSYLDRNAVILTQEEGRLDGSVLHDGAILMK